MNSPSTRQHNGRFITVVGRVKYDHFITRGDGGGYRAIERLCRTGCDRYFRLRGNLPVIETLYLGRNGISQRGDPRHGGILIMPMLNMVIDPIQQGLGGTEVREALTQINCLMPAGQLTDNGKDGGANLR